MGSRASMPRRAAAAAIVGLALLHGACAGPADPARYRLAEAETHWDRVGGDLVFEDVRALYPAFFEAMLEPGKDVERAAMPLRSDLEHQPADRRNFDALNALAIGYFEMNYRAEQSRGGDDGMAYLSLSFQSAKVLAVPWRAYSLVSEAALRDAILDFFEDAGSGRKLGSELTAPRVASIVGSLERKERDPARRRRIQDIAMDIMARSEATAEASERDGGAPR